jgi:hypothetical protein
MEGSEIPTKIYNFITTEEKTVNQETTITSYIMNFITA